MNTQFNQPSRVVNVETNKQAIARVFGIKQNEVAYPNIGQSLDGYKAVYDKSSQRSYLLVNLVQGTTFQSLIKGILATSTGTYDLAKYTASQGYYVHSNQSFTTGFTVSEANEIFSYLGATYRWDADLAITSKIVPPNSTPLTSGGIGTGAWLPVGDTALLNNLASSGSNLVGFKPTFPNELPTTLNTFLKPTYQVERWGAVADGATDSTQAIKNALNDLQGRDAVLLFGAGSYIISSLIQYDLGQKTHLKLQGSGINTTEIKATGSSQSVFKITGPTANIWLNSVLPNGSFDISDMSFGCFGNSTLTGICLDIQLGSVVGGPCKTINIENVNFRAEVGSWAKDISLFNSAQISFTNCKFYAGNNSRKGIAISVSCADGKDGTNLTLMQCEFFFYQHGIYHGNHFEGIVTVNCSFINCDYGITSICTAESGALISNCEFDCYVEGIHLEGLYDFVISGCSFFAMGPNTKGIVIVGGNGFNISGCKIYGTGPADGIAIYLENTNGSLGREGYIGANSIAGYAVAIQVVGCNNLTFGDFGCANCGLDTLISGTNTNVQDCGYSFSKLVASTLASATTTWTVSVDISAKKLSRPPIFAMLVPTSGSNLAARYDFNASSATTAVFQVTLPTGASIPAGSYGFSLMLQTPMFQP